MKEPCKVCGSPTPGTMECCKKSSLFEDALEVAIKEWRPFTITRDPEWVPLKKPASIFWVSHKPKIIVKLLTTDAKPCQCVYMEHSLALTLARELHRPHSSRSAMDKPFFTYNLMNVPLTIGDHVFRRVTK